MIMKTDLIKRCMSYFQNERYHIVKFHFKISKQFSHIICTFYIRLLEIPVRVQILADISICQSKRRRDRNTICLCGKDDNED